MEKLKGSKWVRVFPFIGFLLMWVGPLLLVLMTYLTSDVFSAVSDIAATILAAVCFFLPGIGAILSTFYLESSEDNGLLGKSLATVTIIMCNPLFYILYFLICIFMGNEMAGIPWM